MALAAGARLGPYEILSALGAGGMGEVYRARDTKLGRDVALKILPESFTHDPERIARFRREAQLLAALNHPHIAQIHGLDEANGSQFLVLELVDGNTLGDRLTRGPLPLDETLAIAKQIAEALEAAHEKGIIHRDLKPANVALTKDGKVKVLDFGLAKATVAAGGASSDLANSPTLTSPAMMTGVGVMLGTAAYMSPEQARGKAVDKRADMWAFGCVLFEMLTGRKPFEGETLTDTVAAIVKNEPDWHALPAGTPFLIQSLIAKCLKKDPAHRLHDIADGRLQIEDVLNDPRGAAALVLPALKNRERAAWIAMAVSLMAALLFAVLLLVARRSTTSSSTDAVSFPVFPPEGTTFSAAINTTVNVPSFALSPDGRALVYCAKAPGGRPMLWVRSLDRAGAQQLAGTEDAQDPLWSPDSRWIGFFADTQLKKVPARGGAVQVIAQPGNDFRGGTWGHEDTILFAGGAQPISSVSAAGGKPLPVTTLDASSKEGSHRNPYFLPDGRHFLYTIAGTVLDRNGVYVGALDGKIKKALLHANTNAIYAPPGAVLYVDGDTLLGQDFDAERLELKGAPFVVAEHVGRNTAFMGAVSASRTGTIAYAGTLTENGRLTWIDREGHALGSLGTTDADYTDFRLSPDDQRLAASTVDPRTNTVEIWLTDLARGSTSRFTSMVALVTGSPLWSPDGSQLMFRSNQKGNIEFYQKSAAGGGNERVALSLEDYQRFHVESANLVPTDWSPDGRQIIFSAPSGGGNDLWLLTLGEQGKAVKFIDSPGEQLHGNFSPDGRLVAYTSNESGRFEVYVETVPRSDRKWVISTGGGYEPRWRADGLEVYYLSDDRMLMAVSVGAGPSFGIPKRLFETHVPPGVTANRTHYVPSRDGQRFLVKMATDTAVSPSPITVVVNWTATLKK